MNLVFVTRIVDREDTRSGFIFDWINSLSENVDRLYVICLEKGDTSGLPSNVELGSMGKEHNASQLAELVAYWKLLLKWLPGSHGVLAHMHPIYAIAAWPLTVIYGKKLGLWYTHKSTNILLRIAHSIVDVIFTASKESFRVPSSKVKIMGHGIDVKRFERATYPERSDDVFRIISVGRISPSKDYETLVKAAALLKTERSDTKYEIHIYGDPALESDKSYLVNLLEMTENEELEETVSFHPGVSYGEVPELYANSDLFVNLSHTGSVDKTALEAAASKILVLSSNEALYLPLINISLMLVAANNEPKELAQKIDALKKLSHADRQVITNKLYNWVKSEHDVQSLSKRLVEEYEN